MGDLIDTTEMYLKTIYELEEDGVTPLRARIVERLGHSGPTVSQTVGRMERDGLLFVKGDRRLELTPKGREIATEVMRKHRLAECLLKDIIGMPWVKLHEEACRWEHVMSDEVEAKLMEILTTPQTDPYGNPIPGQANSTGLSAEILVRTEEPVRAQIIRIGEPIQADEEILADFDELGLYPGVLVDLEQDHHNLRVFPVAEEPLDVREYLVLPANLLPHLFVEKIA